MTLKDDFAAKSPITFVYGADGRVCATQRRISSSAVPLYSALMGLNSPRLPKVISVREDDEGAVVTEGISTALRCEGRWITEGLARKSSGGSP